MLKITLIKSFIGYNQKQRNTLKALGLGKIGSSVLHAESNTINGMIRKICHLVSVEKMCEAEVAG